MNLSSSWDLKHRILSKFKDYIDLSALLPVYVKDNYDFTKVDLIITTANKEITREPNCKTLLITPFLTQADQEKLENHIVKTQINRLYNTSLPSIQELFQEAFWHEKVVADDRFSVIEMLAKDFISRGYVSGNYLADILRRESILTFAFQPSIVLMYSLEPSTKTCLSIATLDHRIKWNSYKIRTVIMAAIRPEDITIVFRLINELYYEGFSPDETRFLKPGKNLSISSRDSHKKTEHGQIAHALIHTDYFAINSGCFSLSHLPSSVFATIRILIRKRQRYTI